MSKLEVKGISNNGYAAYQETQKTSNNSNKEEEKKSDKIEISNAARVLQSNPKDLTEIQRKISEGFYNNDKVIEKTVDAILKEFKVK